VNYEVRSAGNGHFEIRGRRTGDIVTVDGVTLTDLSVLAAGEYLYALNLVDKASSVPGRSRLRLAVERSIRSGSDDPVKHLLDVMVSVRWMIPDLVVPDEILRIVVRKLAAEFDTILME
jgi:hypothetical protein